ncbi:hypothetical protein IscW_ISCW005200, partial [Ixodes scapularis]
SSLRFQDRSRRGVEADSGKVSGPSTEENLPEVDRDKEASPAAARPPRRNANVAEAEVSASPRQPVEEPRNGAWLTTTTQTSRPGKEKFKPSRRPKGHT